MSKFKASDVRRSGFTVEAFHSGKITREIDIVVTPDAELAADHYRKVEEKALKAGKLVDHNDGRRVWRTREPRVTFDASGGIVYEFHPDDDDRVRCDWIEYTLKDGERTSRKLRSVWVKWENI